MASITRQRKLARAKLDRQMARRAERERRGRQLKAGIGGTLALVLIGLGAAWKLGAFDSEPTTTAVGQCSWQPQETAVLEVIRDLGLELQVIFNKGAVMVLPAGVTKATGLAAALRDRGYATIGIDLSELRKAGGGPKCCTLVLRERETK